MKDSWDRFDGQYAIITGSTQGVGEATAHELAARGAAGILITGRNTERGEQVVASLRDVGCQSLFVQGDLAEVETCRRIISEAEAAFGAVHVLVNAAAYTTRGSIYNTTVELWDAMMAINARAPFLLTQGCIDLMIRNQIEGAIVNVASVVAHGGLPYLTPYAASKGALVTFTKNVAYAVMRHRIRVNALMLGWTDTPNEDVVQRKFHGNDPDWLAKAEARLPFGRLIKVDEAARVIAWLASRASGMMTGALIDFDQSVVGAGDAPRPAAGDMGTVQ